MPIQLAQDNLHKHSAEENLQKHIARTNCPRQRDQTTCETICFFILQHFLYGLFASHGPPPVAHANLPHLNAKPPQQRRQLHNSINKNKGEVHARRSNGQTRASRPWRTLTGPLRLSKSHHVGDLAAAWLQCLVSVACICNACKCPYASASQL